jgi:hypothetical protein
MAVSDDRMIGILSFRLAPGTAPRTAAFTVWAEDAGPEDPAIGARNRSDPRAFNLSVLPPPGPAGGFLTASDVLAAPVRLRGSAAAAGAPPPAASPAARWAAAAALALAADESRHSANDPNQTAAAAAAAAATVADWWGMLPAPDSIWPAGCAGASGLDNCTAFALPQPPAGPVEPFAFDPAGADGPAVVRFW